MENFEFNKNTICKYTEKELREASLLIAKELEERTYKKKEKLTDAFNLWTGIGLEPLVTGMGQKGASVYFWD